MLLFVMSFVDESVLRCMGNANCNTVICPYCPEGKRHDAHMRDEINCLPMIDVACFSQKDQAIRLCNSVNAVMFGNSYSHVAEPHPFAYAIACVLTQELD